ncbi:MAG: hypothetical protein BWY44_01192 [Candidatus Omnitrophica bacterium ADurb.Bin292]|nr:MAG: hypothetical protein BWY44_01192 [Candidatus Omnitrophica bacterium ADurb.Bin292]
MDKFADSHFFFRALRKLSGNNTFRTIRNARVVRLVLVEGHFIIERWVRGKVQSAFRILEIKNMIGAYGIDCVSCAVYVFIWTHDPLVVSGNIRLINNDKVPLLEIPNMPCSVGPVSHAQSFRTLINAGKFVPYFLKINCIALGQEFAGGSDEGLAKLVRHNISRN